MAIELKRKLLRAVSLAKPLLEAVFSLEARLSEKWVAAAHHRLFLAQWRLLPQPEFFTHKVDLYWQWRHSQNSFWVERGVFSMLAIKQDSNMLELCCGDGFNAHFFYSKRARQILSVDFDPSAIEYAKHNFSLANVSYQVVDIRTQMPVGNYDNIVWDAAIEHFTEIEIEKIMSQVKQNLSVRTGVLSGYTIVGRGDGQKMLSHHEYEFKSKDDLARFFRPHFKHVIVFETIYPARHNLYFWASDGIIPFMPNWDAKMEIMDV